MKKSQASLEFLTTYAWAFIIIVVVIGAIAYFGITNPKKFLPSRCNFSPEIRCIDSSIYNNGLLLRIKNNIGEPIIISALTLSTDNSELTCSSPIIVEPPGEPVIWNTEEVNNIPIICTDFADAGINEGNTEKLKVKLTYYKVKSGITFTNVISGEILGKVKEEALV